MVEINVQIGLASQIGTDSVRFLLFSSKASDSAKFHYDSLSFKNQFSLLKNFTAKVRQAFRTSPKNEQFWNRFMLSCPLSLKQLNEAKQLKLEVKKMPYSLEQIEIF